MQKDRQDGGRAKEVDLGGRPPALKPEHVALLRTIVLETPHATLGELGAELQRRSAVRVCESTIRRSLRAQGIVRLIPKRKASKRQRLLRQAPSATATPLSIDGKQVCPTSLT